jgi:hypothetical protein
VAIATITIASVFLALTSGVSFGYSCGCCELFQSSREGITLVECVSYTMYQDPSGFAYVILLKQVCL